MTTLPFMSADFTSPLIHSLGSSDGIGLPSNAAWLARFFGSLSHVQLSGNSPAKTVSAPKTNEQNAMRNNLLLIRYKWLAGRSVADNRQFVGTRRSNYCKLRLSRSASPRRRRIVRRPLENPRGGTCRTVNQITETVIAKSSPRGRGHR